MLWDYILRQAGGFACVLQNLWQAITTRLKKFIGASGHNAIGWGITDDWHLWCAYHSMLMLSVCCGPGRVEQARCDREPDLANIVGHFNQWSVCRAWASQAGLRAAGRLASRVWTTLVRLNIVKRAAGLSAGCTGKYDREPLDGGGPWVV